VRTILVGVVLEEGEGGEGAGGRRGEDRAEGGRHGAEVRASAARILRSTRVTPAAKQTCRHKERRIVGDIELRGDTQREVKV
jgi:hypothetical protein